MELTITITINSCRACHHSDYSGGFTVRGSRQICGHSDACRARKSKQEFLNEYPEYSKDYEAGSWKYHWYNRTIDSDDIPEWCPLKHGSQY